DDLNHFVQNTLDDSTADGMEYRVYNLYTRCIEHLSDMVFTEEPARETSAEDPKDEPVNVSLVVIWSHHLLATSKRKDILEWSEELDLCTISKPGYPGVIVVEGLEDMVKEFVSRIKSLNWQALSVRHEETSVIAEDKKHLNWISSSQLHTDSEKKIREVEHISEIVKGLSPELEEKILTALRIQKTNG
ncbi:RWD domain containing 2B, partial [Planoprotostelium fungivorum]